MYKFFHGPVNKSIASQSLELLTKCLLRSPNSMPMKVESIHGEQAITVRYADSVINVSSLLKKADISHIKLDSQDSSHYLSQGISYYTSYNHQHQYAKMTHAEQLAIRDFTASSYNMNNLLYNQLSGYEIKNNTSEIFIKTIMVGSGLNNIEPVQGDTATYRGESTASYETIQERIQMIKHVDYSHESAYKSTSTDKWVAQEFGEGKCVIEFENTNGKDISGLSHYQSESEVLLNIEKLYWSEHKIKDNTHYFKASIAYPLDPSVKNVDATELDQMISLLDYAENLGIHCDFITDYNQNLINDYVHSKELILTKEIDALSLHDIFSEKSINFDNLEEQTQNINTSSDISHEANRLGDDIIIPSSMGLELSLLNLPEATAQLEYI